MARELVSIRPLKEWAEMESDLERLMDAYLYGRPKFNCVAKQRNHPVDICETKDDIVITAEIPGLELEDFSISLNGSILTIDGEKREDREGKEVSYHLEERVYGPFIRLINLHKQVQSDKIKTTYKDGVLTIKLRKAEEKKKKEIKIKPE